MVGNKSISKSASRAAYMPTDHLHKHGTSASAKTLFLSLSGEVTEYLRGGWEYLRACLKVFGELGDSTGKLKLCLSIFAHLLNIFGGSIQYLRGVLSIYGER